MEIIFFIEKDFLKYFLKIVIIFKLIAMTVEILFNLHVTNGYTYMNSNTNKICLNTRIPVSISLVYKQI